MTNRQIKVPKTVHYTKCCGARHSEPCHEWCEGHIKLNLACDNRRRQHALRCQPLPSGDRDPWMGR